MLSSTKLADPEVFTGIDTVCYGAHMNPMRVRITELEGKGWTLAAIATELGVSYNAVQKWKAGDRHPANAKAVLAALEALANRKRIPKRRRSGPERHSETS